MGAVGEIISCVPSALFEARDQSTAMAQRAGTTVDERSLTRRVVGR